MAKKIARNNYYGEPKEVVKSEEQNIVPYVEPVEEVSKAFDFSNITIEQLGSELESTINTRTPFFIWSRERLNRKIKLDNEKQLLILEKIQNLRLISEEFCRLRADSFFSNEYIDNLIKEKRIDAEQYFESKIAEHRKKLTYIKTDILLNEGLVTHDVLSQEKQRAEIRIQNAEAEKIEVKSEESKVKVQLIKKIIGEVKFDNLPPVYQTYLLTTFLNADITKLNEFEVNEKMKEIIVQQAQAEANKKTAEADSAKADTDMKKFNNEQAKKDAGL